MHLFRGDQRKTLAQIKAHLMAKHAARASAGAVTFCHTGREDVAHEVFVLAANRAVKGLGGGVHVL